MEVVTVNSGPPNTTVTHEEISENATILDEGIRLCPLCRSEVRLFFINFNEKIVMCENVDCEYPFGHEDIIYLKEYSEVQFNEEVASIKTNVPRHSSTATFSTVSTAAWSDIDKITKVYEAEEQFDHRPYTGEFYTHRNNSEAFMKAVENEQKMLKEVGVIKKLSMELSTKVHGSLKNEKWIKNLMKKQEMSGVSLLKPEEVKLFKTKQLDIGMGELKIDIDMGNDSSMSSIKIELANVKDSCEGNDLNSNNK